MSELGWVTHLLQSQMSKKKIGFMDPSPSPVGPTKQMIGLVSFWQVGRFRALDTTLDTCAELEKENLHVTMICTCC